MTGKDKLAEFLGVPVEQLQDEGAIVPEGMLLVATNNGNSTSWSAKKKITRDFSERGERRWDVTLIADVENNPHKFLAGPGSLYDVVGLSMFHLKKETVGLEPILIRRIEWEKL